MGQKLATSSGETLYDYWGDKITKALLKDFEEFGDIEDCILLNVASNEYFRSIKSELLAKITIVDCVFKDEGKIKSVYAKRARGLMCRYVLSNEINTLDQVKQFGVEGYKFSERESTEQSLVFTRSKQAAEEAVSANRKRRKLNDA